MENLYKYLGILLLMLGSCNKITKISISLNKKFYKVYKSEEGEFILKKGYFESEMVSYKFEENKLIDGTNIMEHSVYQIDIVTIKDSVFTIKMHLLENSQLERELNFIYKKNLGIIEVIHKDYKEYYVDSLFLDRIKTIKIPPCDYNSSEYKMSKEEYDECVEEYLKSEELNRIKEEDFSWYGKLNCEKYFNKETCNEFKKEEKKIEKQKIIKQKVKLLLSNQIVSKKWQGNYHYLDVEGYTAGGDWTGHYTEYKITKDSVHLTTSGRMSGREDYYLAEEKGDTLLLYRYQMLTGDKSLYKNIALEKLYKKGDNYYFLVNGEEKKGVKLN